LKVSRFSIGWFVLAARPFCVFETPFGGLRGNVWQSS